ncbi:hypothetical protein BDV96DRAFT_605497 [Lophiotrema nucula]|uniref:Uncharacterized protein n=1 Tax=Lophiotrema nucula TaxID=690887 RepID=A0A6A5YNN2_9PLEO|nr:hypothetical protein BDV96DRAFT_605497 [Lophiotrema nucula]
MVHEKLASNARIVVDKTQQQPVSHTFTTQIVLWVPLLFTLMLRGALIEGFKNSRRNARTCRDFCTPTHLVVRSKTSWNTPRGCTSRCRYSSCVGTLVWIRSPKNLKVFAFWLHFLTTLAIRCVSSISGWMVLPSHYAIIFNSNSIGKPLFLWLLVELRFWDWTYLGRYSDGYFDEERRCVLNQHGMKIHTFVAKDWKPDTREAKYVSDIISKTSDRIGFNIFNTYIPRYLPEPDVIVRLSYIHLVDNIIHVVWLRYFYEHGPYTIYINNSELLTVSVFTQLVIYTYARMKSHIVFTNNELPLVEVKSTAPL